MRKSHFRTPQLRGLQLKRAIPLQVEWSENDGVIFLIGEAKHD